MGYRITNKEEDNCEKKVAINKAKPGNEKPLHKPLAPDTGKKMTEYMMYLPIYYYAGKWRV